LGVHLQVWPAFAVGLDHRLHDAESVAHRILVFGRPRLGAIGDDALHVELVGVNEETDEGLLIVRISAGIGLDDDARTGAGKVIRAQGMANREEQPKDRKETKHYGRKDQHPPRIRMLAEAPTFRLNARPREVRIAAEKRTLDMRLFTQLLLGVAAGAAANAWLERRDQYNFEGRVVLITGGSRGLGLTLARELAVQGARLMLVARDSDELDRAVAELRNNGAEAESFAGDVTQPETAINAVAATIGEFGRLDVLINNAGVITMGPLDTMNEQDFETCLATHVWAPLRFMNAALPHLQRSQGRIVNIASFGGKFAVPHMAPYCTSKFGLVGLSDAYRAEVAQSGVSVTTVCPGLMRAGSHVHAQFKGHHAREFAWFVMGLSSSLTSMSVERAAKQILRACQLGKSRVVVGLQAKLAVLGDALFPNLSAALAKMANHLLPGSPRTPGMPLRGSDARGPFPPRAITSLADSASAKHNET
jgi:short-subunit dehydrogenase